jgi:hypothetical protein
MGWFHDGSGHLWHARFDGTYIKFQKYRAKRKSFKVTLVEVFNTKILALQRNRLLVRIHGAGDLQRNADFL